MQPGREERFPQAVSVLLGALIAASIVVLVLSFVAWFTPRFLHFSDSRWSHLLTPVAAIVISISALIHARRRNRLKEKGKRSPA
jgi:low affinity Fe/Cu permease